MQNSKLLVETPSLKRRMICLVYDAFLIFAVLFFALMAYALATSSLTGPLIEHGNKLLIFLAAGAYFIHSWSGSGFTLAMKTWRIKVVKVGAARVPFKNAALRYLASWGWVLSGGLIYQLSGRQGKLEMGLSLLAGVMLWALTALLDKDRQFLHDKLAGTRLISLPKHAKAAAKAA